MKTMQASKMAPPIFIGRWTPKVLFSLKESLIVTGSCAATLEASPNGCSQEIFGVSNRRD